MKIEQNISAGAQKRPSRHYIGCWLDDALKERIERLANTVNLKRASLVRKYILDGLDLDESELRNP